MNNEHPEHRAPAQAGQAERWANRALACATIAILVCTISPFDFFLAETAARRAGPFWCWFNPYPDGVRDFADNILLFAPFGFAWACWTSKKRWGRFWGPGVALVAGAGLSFTVEFLQLFLPTREASWADVLSNTLGSLWGYFLFAPLGDRALSLASRWELRIERFLSGRRIVAIFAGYTALCCGVSAGLQRSTHLRNWHPSGTLHFGSGSIGPHSWRGRILGVELASRVSLQGPDRAPNYVAVPFPDQNGGWAEPLPGAALPAATVLREIPKTNQFTLRIRCAPDNVVAKAFGVILALPDHAGYDDIDLVQRGRDLIFSVQMPDLGNSRYWDLHMEDLFKGPEPREVVLTYDGANLAGYVDGRKASHSLRVCPGTILVSRFKGIKPYNLRGYEIMYDLLVFVPLGVLLGFAVRKPFAPPFVSRILLGSGLLAPPLLEESILAGVSGRPFQFGNLILGICLMFTAWLVLNSGRLDSTGFAAMQTCDVRMVAGSFPRNAALASPTDSSSPRSS